MYTWFIWFPPPSNTFIINRVYSNSIISKCNAVWCRVDKKYHTMSYSRYTHLICITKSWNVNRVQTTMWTDCTIIFCSSTPHIAKPKYTFFIAFATWAEQHPYRCMHQQNLTISILFLIWYLTLKFPMTVSSAGTLSTFKYAAEGWVRSAHRIHPFWHLFYPFFWTSCDSILFLAYTIFHLVCSIHSISTNRAHSVEHCSCKGLPLK